MKGILADVNIQGYVDLLVVQMRAEPWLAFWDYLQIAYFHFDDVGLAPSALDSVVWETCQREEIVLITDNRNQGDRDSLEATIQLRNTLHSLPVFTIANVPRLRASKQYASRVVERFLDALLHIDALRGAGRVYLP